VSSLKSTESISKGLDISMKNPSIFIPVIAPLVIHLLFVTLDQITNVGLFWVGYFLASIVGFIASCMIVDMANDVINGRPMNLNKSLNFVMGKLGTLILVAIISAICSITVILIPVAFFIITIAIVEGTDALQSTERAVDFVIKNLGEVVIFTIIVVVVSIVFGFAFALIPIVGSYIGPVIMWIINVIFTASAVYLYLTLRQPSLPPPPPPPPE